MKRNPWLSGRWQFWPRVVATRQERERESERKHGPVKTVKQVLAELEADRQRKLRDKWRPFWS